MLRRCKSYTSIIIDRNPHVQPAVTIDNVVTGITFDKVVTATAKDDIMWLVHDVGCNASTINGHVGCIKHGDGVGFAIGGRESYTIQMGNDLVETINSGDAFRRQRV